MIKFDQVTKTYGTIPAIKNVTLEIHKGEFLSLVGQSGAGKSTLISLIIGEDKPDSGQILIDDIDVAQIRRADIPYLRRKIGVVFQDLFPVGEAVYAEAHRPAFQSCLAPTVRVPESFRGGCSFGVRHVPKDTRSSPAGGRRLVPATIAARRPYAGARAKLTDSGH